MVAAAKARRAVGERAGRRRRLDAAAGASREELDSDNGGGDGAPVAQVRSLRLRSRDRGDLEASPDMGRNGTHLLGASRVGLKFRRQAVQHGGVCSVDRELDPVHHELLLVHVDAVLCRYNGGVREAMDLVAGSVPQYGAVCLVPRALRGLAQEAPVFLHAQFDHRLPHDPPEPPGHRCGRRLGWSALRARDPPPEHPGHSRVPARAARLRGNPHHEDRLHIVNANFHERRPHQSDRVDRRLLGACRLAHAAAVELSGLCLLHDRDNRLRRLRRLHASYGTRKALHVHLPGARRRLLRLHHSGALASPRRPQTEPPEFI